MYCICEIDNQVVLCKLLSKFEKVAVVEFGGQRSVVPISAIKDITVKSNKVFEIKSLNKSRVDSSSRVVVTYNDASSESSKVNDSPVSPKVSFDNVNHPSHYAGKYECIDVIKEVFGDDTLREFCLANAFKYLWRHRNKNGEEDIKKCIWYLKRYLTHYK